MDAVSSSFLHAFQHPSDACGEVPFYWWTGERLDKARLLKQLQTLHENGVAGVQINYAHMLRGGEEDLPYGGPGRSIPGNPPVFSEEWWDFFCFAARQCDKMGMGIGVGDYTLAWIGNGFYTDCVASMPGMNAENLSCEAVSAEDWTDSVPDGDVLAAVCYTDSGSAEPVVLYDRTAGKSPAPAPAHTPVYLLRLHTTPFSLNPLHPACGRELVKIYFEEFERRLPELKKGTLNYFFQDELMFGCEIRTLWRENLRAGIMEKYGYDVLGFLPHLFFDLGDITPKIRMHIADVRTQIMEDSYFRPVFEFHHSRGLVYGCDQSSRGKQPDEFGDYFRTVRWFTAPGNDTPGRNADCIKVKVNSSIAHLYERDRVWLEGYHSSGWGTTLESLTNATDDNFAFGANLLNLHGLYYTTNGGFFEWAPPDFHFRMPYWEDEKDWLLRYKRLSSLLTTGKHRCDIAVYYPVSSCDYGENAEKCVGSTFQLAETLCAAGMDFDFIDFQSLERAVFADGCICVAGEKYRALVFADVDCLHFSTVSAVKQYVRSGGQVFFKGILPYISDKNGKNDQEMKAILDWILLQPGVSAHEEDSAVLSALPERIRSGFVCVDKVDGKRYVNRRTSENADLYFTRYIPEGTLCRLEGRGNACRLDIRTGKTETVRIEKIEDGYVYIRIPATDSGSCVLLLTEEPVGCALPIPAAARQIGVRSLQDGWQMELLPTLDNTYGDFYKPNGGMIGAQARFFDCTPAVNADTVPDTWMFENRPYCESASLKLLFTADTGEAVRTLCKKPEQAEQPFCPVGGSEIPFVLQPIHDRRGYVHPEANRERSLYEQGYHGLKGKIYDDNLFFDSDCVAVADVWSEEQREASLYLCGCLPEKVFVNGTEICSEKSFQLQSGKNRLLAVYRYDPEAHTEFRNRSAVKRAGIYCVKSPDHIRRTYELTKSDFCNDGFFPMTAPGTEGELYAVRFVSAPGTEKLTAGIRGKLCGVLVNGSAVGFRLIEKGRFRTYRYESEIPVTGECSVVVLFIYPEKGVNASGLLPEPIDLRCRRVTVRLQDTLDMGALCCYSGRFVYTRKITVKETDRKKTVLDLGKVGVTANVSVNGQKAAVLTYAPFCCDITPYLKEGENTLTVIVSNTLSNHYSTIPSGYSGYPQDASSGLMGPVRLLVYEKGE